jgi:lysozyme family protein
MNFDVCIDRVLAHEGGYVNDSRDPGGETRFGISKRAYPSLDIKRLTREAAAEIYRRDYWRMVRGDDLPLPVAFQVFDAAVNHGNDRAIRWLQDSAGVTADGKFGPVTLAAIRSTPPAEIVLRFNARRAAFYVGLSTFDRFGAGWIRRIADNLALAATDLAAA